MKQKFNIIIFSIVLFWSFSANATMTRMASLAELISLAQYIVLLKVTDIQSEFDQYESGRYATYITGEVVDCAKGHLKEGDKFTYKQLAKGIGIPVPVVGKTYLLFLPKATSTGLIAPLGLFQGMFLARFDGQDYQLPQLSKRKTMLKHNLGKTASSKAMLKDLDNLNDNSYKNFKQVIQRSLDN